MKPIIKVENLSKQYVIGGKSEPYATLRESLINAARLPLNALKRRNGKNGDNQFWALKDINFTVNPGEVIGIIGRNGAGKSTLLKILSRITEPTTGRIELYGRVGSLLEVGTGFHPELTGRENIYLNGAILGMRQTEIAKKFDEIVDFAEVEKFLDTPVKRYSSGMYTRLAFAVAANLETEILAVDEVLAVGDAEFQKKCLGKMEDVSKQGKTVLFVSHNMSSISKLCNKGLYLLSGKIEQIGDIQTAMAQYLQQNKKTEAGFKDGIVKSISVRQEQDTIVIEAEYDYGNQSRIPCLGFIISDSLGSPVCGTNPVVDKSPNLIKSKKGVVKVIIKQPKLLDGDYRLSLWFGNGMEDFFIQKDCLVFEIIEMSPYSLTKSINGNVFPECEWHFG